MLILRDLSERKFKRISIAAIAAKLNVHIYDHFILSLNNRCSNLHRSRFTVIVSDEIMLH